MSFNSGFFIQQSSTTPPTQYSMSFDGVNESLASSYSAQHELDYTDLISFSFWIKPTAAQLGGIVSKYNPGSIRGWATYINSTRGIYLDLISDSTSNNRLLTESNTKLTLNTWSHVVITYGGGGGAAGVKFYINSVSSNHTPVLDGLNQTTINPASNVTFGVGHPSSFYYAGYMYDVRVWKGVVLSQLEVTDLFNNSTDLYNSNLIIWNECGANGLFGTNTWVLPDKVGISTGFQSNNMEFGDRTTDLP